MWISNSLAIAWTSLLLVQSSAARSEVYGSPNRVNRRPRATGDATPAQVIGATYVASSIVATATCGTAGNATSCLVYDVTAGFNNSLTFAENFVSITAAIQVLILSNGGDTTIPLEILKAILPQPPTIDQIAAGDFYVAPIINAITGAIIIAVRPQVSTSTSTPAATLAQIMPATTSSADAITTTPILIQQQPPSSTVVQQPASSVDQQPASSSSAAASVVIVVPASSSTYSIVVVAASSTVNNQAPASSSAANTYVAPSSSAANTYVALSSTYIPASSSYAPVTSNAASSTYTPVTSAYTPATSTYTPATSSASNVPATSSASNVPVPTSTYIPATTTPNSVSSSVKQPLTTSATSNSVQASASSNSQVAPITSTTTTTISFASTSAATAPSTSTFSSSSTVTSSSTSSAASSSPSGNPDSSYQAPNSTLVGTIAVTYSTDRTLRYLSGEGFTTDQYGQESAFSILTYQDECAEYNNNTLNAVSLSTTGADGSTFYLGFDMNAASNATTFDYTQKYAQPSSNTQIFLIDCMTKAISINSDAGLTICTNNDSLFVTDEDCVTAGGQATNPIFTFVPASTYFSTFNGYSSAPFTQ